MSSKSIFCEMSTFLSGRSVFNGHMIIPDFWRIRCLRLLSFLWLRQLQQPKSLPLRQMSVSLALASNDNWVKNLIPTYKQGFEGFNLKTVCIHNSISSDINMSGSHTEMKRKSNFTVGLHSLVCCCYAVEMKAVLP